MSDGSSLFTSTSGASANQGVLRVAQPGTAFGALNTTGTTVTNVFINGSSFHPSNGELHASSISSAIFNGPSSMFTFDCK